MVKAKPNPELQQLDEQCLLTLEGLRESLETILDEHHEFSLDGLQGVLDDYGIVLPAVALDRGTPEQQEQAVQRAAQKLRAYLKRRAADVK